MRLFRGRRLLVEVCLEQQHLLKFAAGRIAELEAEREELRRQFLASLRMTLSLTSAFRISQETPEIDVRDDLDDVIRDLSDQVAQIEEHLV